MSVHDDLTVIYYSSNREDPAFEGRIRQHHLSVMGDLPVISVTQKPIDFGHNICVGDVGVSGQNALRQYQIGCELATTKCVCAAESDMLYPADYFAYRPPTDYGLHCAMPVYLVFTHGNRRQSGFFPKRHSEGATIANREYVLRLLEEELEGKSLWRDGVERGREEEDDHPGFFRDRRRPRTYVSLSKAIISFRTEHQMHRKTPYREDGRVETLPMWGDSQTLVRHYVDGEP